MFFSLPTWARFGRQDQQPAADPAADQADPAADQADTGCIQQ